MKLTNHQKNNFYDVDTSVMRGTISMTPNEYKKVYAYLCDQYQKAVKSIDTYKRDNLSSLKKETNKLFCLGVVATALIAKKWKLKRYNNGINYGIKINRQ